MPDTVYGHNVFAILTARDHKNEASSAFELPENSRWFHKAVGGVAEEPTINSREATPAIDDLKSEDEKANVTDRLIVTFDGLVDDLQNGIQFGTNPSSSHILLGHRGTKGISARQCTITVDDAHLIWLHDYSSRHGTAVGHQGQNQKEVHKNETWILAYAPGIYNPFGETTIHLGSLIIGIEFPNHISGHPLYVKNLKTFVKKCEKAAEKRRNEAPAVDELGLDSEPSTQAPSEVQTPSGRLIYYDEGLLGKGGFGEVRRVVRIRDGNVFAAKIFRSSANKRKLGETGSEWLICIRREFTLMKDNPHPNVIQVFEFRETPEPMIIMAIYSDGTIMDVDIDDDKLYISAFGQILDGLKHLHAKGVVHRDLKPDNFLVEKSPCFKVVLTDFGLSKMKTKTSLLTTFCGTMKYIAPEVFLGRSDGYGPSADIWSLGVIVFEWTYGIPPQPAAPTALRTGIPSQRRLTWIDAWVTALLNKLDDQDEDQVIEILNKMIEHNTRTRWGAQQCLTRGFENGLFQRRQADGLVCASNSEDLVIATEEWDARTKRSTAVSPPQSQTSLSREATVITGNLWAEEDLAPERTLA